MAFLTAKEAKLYALVVAGVTILALVGTLVFVIINRGSQTEQKSSTPRAEVFAGSNTGESVLQKIRVPEKYKQLYQQEWYPFRKVHGSWSEEQIAPFWKDPQVLIQEVLQKESDREIEEFFEEIP